MAGAFATNAHTGHRSEYLALYVLSAWGTAVGVPQHEDHGVDLFCCWAERDGNRSIAQLPYSVQVKSTLEGWELKEPHEVKWVVEYPSPLFFCAVEKEQAQVTIWHLASRFYLWTNGTLPDAVHLACSLETANKEAYKNIPVPLQWNNGTSVTLGPPILRFTIPQFLDPALAEIYSQTLRFWIEWDYEMLRNIRSGVREFSVPFYETNRIPDARKTVHFTRPNRPSTDKEFQLALHGLKDPLRHVANNAWLRDDKRGAILALLVMRHWFSSTPPGMAYVNEIAEHLAGGVEVDSHESIGELEAMIDARIGQPGV